MNHSINEILENMLPSLQYFANKKIFSKQEVSMIVKKRKQTEYKVRGLNATPETFCGCIQFEIKLEKLRRKRRKRLGIEKTQKEDHAIVSRIHHLFQRGLRKYSNDLTLWWFYFDFCSQSRSGSALSRAFTRCLQLHPHAEIVWLRAANWEFFSNGDILGARKLLQRAIELNSSSCLLWKGYFKLELKNVQKMRARAKVLNVSDKMRMEETPNKLIDEALYAQEIFKLAVKQVKNNPQFLTELSSLIPSVEYYPELMKTAYQTIRSLIIVPEVSGFVFNWLYKYHLQDNQSETKAWLKCFDDVEETSPPESREALIPLIWDHLQRCEDKEPSQYLLKKLTKYIGEVESPTLETVTMLLQINFCLGSDEEQTIARLEEHRSRFSKNIQWWLLLIDLLRLHGDDEKLEKTIWQATMSCGNHPKLLLCIADIAETKGFEEANRDYRKLVAKAMKDEAIHRRYFLWTLRTHKDTLDDVIHFLTTNACVSAETFSFFASKCSDSSLDPSVATKLLNQSCAIYGAKNPDVWLNLLKQLHAVGMLAQVPDVFLRAMAILEEPSVFLSTALQYRV